MFGTVFADNANMATKRSSMTESKITAWVKEGRGRGIGREYLPWFTIQDVKSRGRSHRGLGRKTNRIHHLLSDLEWRLFLHLDWCDDVTDIREQFPLNRQITTRIAEELRIRHPKDPSTKITNVMTTDVLVDLLRDGVPTREACYVKPSKELENKRNLEKLEIERRFWKEQGVPLRIFTEKEFQPVITSNLDWFRQPSDVDQVDPWAGFDRQQVTAVLEAIASASPQSLRTFCVKMDHDLALGAGGTLAIVRRLLMTKTLSTDLTKPINDHRAMKDFVIMGKVMRSEAA